MSERIDVLHVIFKGRVQGVGFRWTVVDHAEKYHLKGTVQNLADGTVEVFAHGPKVALETFVTSVKREPGLARIDSVDYTFQLSSSTFQDFRIIY